MFSPSFNLFPMNLPLPYLRQPVLAFGGAASMVHPASGYMVGSLRRPDQAQSLAEAISNPALGSATLAQRGWQAAPLRLGSCGRGRCGCALVRKNP